MTGTETDPYKGLAPGAPGSLAKTVELATAENKRYKPTTETDPYKGKKPGSPESLATTIRLATEENERYKRS